MYCPLCGSETSKAESLLGALGRLMWFRCRHCGGQWSKKVRKSVLKKKGVYGA